MAAFGVGTALGDQRDLLRQEIKRLQAVVALAGDWVEALERDRLPLSGADETSYDAARLSTATALLSQLQLETSASASTALNVRIRSTLGVSNTPAL
jgi:hypothetical protein